MKLQVPVFLILFLGVILNASAAEDSAYTEKARTRQYIGGADESDLKVQAVIPKLQKSKNETSIEEENSEEGF